MCFNYNFYKLYLNLNDYPKNSHIPKHNIKIK